MTTQNSLKNFNGIFTQEIRFLLQSKRQELGFTMQKAAHFCQVNISTYRKWEDGPTKYCCGDKILQLKKFMNFRNDYKYLHYNMHSDSFHISIQRSLPEEIYTELEQQFSILHLCQGNLFFMKEYIRALNDFNQKQIKKFIQCS